ncbi:MAG TPA: HD-GYP domain-containing protein [Acidimicrobiales bacterium]|nr:HD-GYP domain-containing protein [Acidimicrobiales bacterium]
MSPTSALWVVPALLASGHSSRSGIVVPFVGAAVLLAVVALFWAAQPGGRMLDSLEEPEENRWRRRPVLAAALVGIAHIVPLAAAVGVSALLSRRLPAPDGLFATVVTWVVLVVVSTIVLFVVGRLARRLLPLAALLKLSMLFPDHAPQRLAVARKAGSIRDLENRLATARTAGLNDEPAQAAEKILTLVGALHAHDRRTRGHSERVRMFVDLLAEELKLPVGDRDRLRWAALLHDIGKLDIDPELLNKPDKLDADEWRIIHDHPDAGARLARPLRSWLGPWAPTIEQHHERWDGTGYPRRLRGDQMCLGARIVGVADSFEVMTGVRPYKRPMSVPAAREELTRHSGSQFDPAVVRAFLNVSIGRVRWGVGPLCWIAQIPFVGWIPGLAQSVVSTGGQVAGAIGAGAGAAALTTAGVAVGILPVAPADDGPADRGTEAASTDGAGGAGGGAAPTPDGAGDSAAAAPGVTSSSVPAPAVAGGTSTTVSPAPGGVATPGTSTTSTPGTPGGSTTSTSAPPTTTTVPEGFGLRRLEMSDVDANGRVDTVVATFSEPLAPSSSTEAWTLTGVPSGGRLRSVTVAGERAFLAVTEGSGARDTAVGDFTVALASSADGIRSQSGEAASFAARAPEDRASPVPVGLSSVSIGPKAGRIEPRDELRVSFSEALAATSFPSMTTVSEIDPDTGGNDLVAIDGVSDGLLDTGSGGYIVLEERTAIFGGSTVGLADDGRTLTVVVGPTCTSCGGRRSSAGVLTFRPAANLTDGAGNGARGSITTAADFQLF